MASKSELVKLVPAMDYGMRTAQRYITTLDDKGKSIFVPQQEIMYCDRGSYAASWTYATNNFPAVLQDNKDLKDYLTDDPSSQSSVVHTGTRIVNPGGIVFCTTNFSPGTETRMHRTISLDFTTLVEGEMELELDSGEKVLLKAGDSIVQRLTNHIWRNVSKDKPARLIAVITPSQPVTINGDLVEQEGFSVRGMGKSAK